MKKLGFSMIIILMLLLAFQGYAFCAWQDFFGLSYSTPVPAGATEEAREKAFMMDSDFTIIIYSVPSAFEEVAKFYRMRLTQDGWVEIKNNEKVKTELASRGVYYLPLTFRKEEDAIVVAYLGNYSGTVKFSVSRGQPYYFKVKEGESLPEPRDIQLKDVPVYPQAVVIPASSVVTPVRQQVAYNTADTPEQVLNFYRERLPVTGWVIQDEIPLTNYYPSSLKDCPNCQNMPKDLLNAISNSSMVSAGIKATRWNDECIIGVSSAKGEVAQNGNGTIITMTLSKVKK